MLCRTSANNKHLLDATQGLFLFGAPHGGLRTEELERMVADLNGPSRPSLNHLRHLKRNSDFLDEQAECMVDIWARPGFKVVSFYETRGTPTVEKV